MRSISLAALFVAGSYFIASSSWSAVIDSGVETSVKKFVLAPGSTVSLVHDFGTVRFDGLGNTFKGGDVRETRNVAGSFDVEFSRHWWEYELIGGRGATAIKEGYWVRLLDLVLTGVESWSNVTLFSRYIASRDATYAELYNSFGCSFHYPRFRTDISLCIEIGTFDQIRGGLSGSSLTLDGIISGAAPDNDYKYRIVATAVPLPATVWMLVSALAGLVGFNRYRVTRKQA